MKTKVLKGTCLSLLILIATLSASKYIIAYRESIRTDYFQNAKGKAQNFIISYIR